MKYCNNCHHPLEDSVKFCPNCGAQNGLQPQPAAFCTNCGNSMTADSQFCPRCGSPVGAAQQVPQTSIWQTPAAEPRKKGKTGLIVAVVVLVLALVVGACWAFGVFGNDPIFDFDSGSSSSRRDRDEDEEEEDEDEDEDREAAAGRGTTDRNGVTTYKVGIAIYNFNDNFITLYWEEMVSYFKSLETDTVKYDITIADGKNDVTEQTAQVENFITQGMDVIILNPVRPDSADELIDKIVAADIPLVLINREPLGETDESYPGIVNNPNVCYVGVDARQAGYYQGLIVVETDTLGDINGDGVVKYVMIQGDSENIEAQYRTEYSIKALEDAGIAVECLVNQVGNWDQYKGGEIAAAALAQYGSDIDVIFCNNDAMALGALAAIENAGLAVGEDIYLLGIDALDEVVQRVNEGRMTGTIQNDYIGQAHTAVELAIRLLNGERVENYYWVDFIKITAD